LTARLVVVKMVYLHQYDYLFAIGTIFAFGDAWGIGTSTCSPVQSVSKN
jgi:hypothetical protein